MCCGTTVDSCGVVPQTAFDIPVNQSAIFPVPPTLVNRTVVVDLAPVAEDIDGSQICCSSYATMPIPRTLPAFASSQCVNLDFSPPQDGVVFDGRVPGVSTPYFSTSTVYFSWTGSVDGPTRATMNRQRC